MWYKGVKLGEIQVDVQRIIKAARLTEKDGSKSKKSGTKSHIYSMRKLTLQVNLISELTPINNDDQYVYDISW